MVMQEIMAESNFDGDIPAEMRREQMLTLVRSRDFVRVSDLSTRFRVSEVTVRGDLDALAERGQIRRVRGGAMPRTLPHPERPFEEMQSARVDEKAMIGRAAASLVSHGETVILDVGTTTTAVARALTKRDDLYDVVVFTNALNIAIELESAIPRLTVVVTGGTLRPMQHSLVDPLGELMLECINAHTVFIKRRMLQAARRRIIVADGSKVGEIELAKLCSIEEIDLLITDGSADPAVLNALRERDLEIMLASERSR